MSKKTSATPPTPDTVLPEPNDLDSITTNIKPLQKAVCDQGTRIKALEKEIATLKTLMHKLAEFSGPWNQRVTTETIGEKPKEQA